MVSVVSRGFREDLLGFLSNFAAIGSPLFETYSQEWRKQNFQYIFYGRATVVELVEYTIEVLHIVKQAFLSSKNQLERIGAFFTLYTLYFKQPSFMFCKIRLTLPQWRAFREFVDKPFNNQPLPQISLILWKLFQSDAFLFVQEDVEHGFDSFMAKRSTTGTFDDKERLLLRLNSSMEKELSGLHAPDGLLKGLEILEMAYNEMKEKLQDGEPSSSDAIAGDKIPQSTLMESLRSDFDLLVVKTDGATDAGTEQNDPSEQSEGVSLESDPLGQGKIGDKRYNIRRKAYKTTVAAKKFQIAGQPTDDADPEEPDASSVGEAIPTASHDRTFKNDRGRSRFGFKEKHSLSENDNLDI
ncbi:uncharacterized protein LOC128277646 [Anopheles cruzii]|uniref:uncharacterized protein LOC128277646 n=1 Tax=Anopheles cruzii TaxID=68878 RepID=UPI0022EC23EE|nr:uncharacterized protein LOC128277646 [Anopheles cruzii]